MGGQNPSSTRLVRKTDAWEHDSGRWVVIRVITLVEELVRHTRIVVGGRKITEDTHTRGGTLYDPSTS
ncbi:hypothetical protein PtrM4_129870 [Pyrenophora tritici-repentis]|uniref:Uncharacterized protein n=1 Tax=Pyrenophora tritici-repentis TaxID=45151 RepID=A0A834VMW4_9PLEO|nr:hypothetical protein PtrM4_129870 [Pyrenophora tritici-repentis]KAI1507779.1 hypothetical protein Ptr86124_013312 [Pyrenophora tritici-repentis]KAI1683821.1 hypothetical protein KJE20_06326 [Pyrenophora tritici-repentis]